MTIEKMCVCVCVCTCTCVYAHAHNYFLTHTGLILSLFHTPSLVHSIDAGPTTLKSSPHEKSIRVPSTPPTTSASVLLAVVCVCVSYTLLTVTVPHCGMYSSGHFLLHIGIVSLN
eukprot:GHVR01143983.1.p1 GENE.GHVR01143983.1~~GHVR01143983.1.p1  ORF type:complete len:115 (-),score=24.93 GHVR01143983.1:678-1022(-)